MNTRDVLKEITETWRRVDDSYLRIARDHGLTYNSLMLLYMVEDWGQLTQKQICDGLLLQKSTVHSILRGLMDRGLVELTEGRNRKEKYVVLTEEGKKFMEPVDVETDRIESAGVRSASEPDLMTFLRVSRAFADSMTEEADRIYTEPEHVRRGRDHES